MASQKAEEKGQVEEEMTDGDILFRVMNTRPDTRADDPRDLEDDHRDRDDEAARLRRKLAIREAQLEDLRAFIERDWPEMEVFDYLV